MGFLTTITFRNDEFAEITKDPKRLAEKIQAAMSGNLIDDGMMMSQRPVHSSEQVVYVCAGNTIVDVSNPSNERMQDLRDRVPAFYVELMNRVKACASELGKVWRERKK